MSVARARGLPRGRGEFPPCHPQAFQHRGTPTPALPIGHAVCPPGFPCPSLLALQLQEGIMPNRELAERAPSAPSSRHLSTGPAIRFPLASRPHFGGQEGGLFGDSLLAVFG
jgi:hypothetical protein